MQTSQPHSTAVATSPLAWLDYFPPTLSRETAARALGVSTRHLDRAIARGEVKAMKLGRKVLILRESLRAWATAGLGAG